MSMYENGMVYESLTKRTMAFFLSTFAEEPKEAKWKEAYNFLHGLYEFVGNHPKEFGLKDMPDLSFDAWEHQKGREKDVKAIRDNRKKMEEFLETFLTCMEGAVCGEQGLKLSAEALGVMKPAFAKKLGVLGCPITEFEDGRYMVMTPACGQGLLDLYAIAKEWEQKPDYGDGAAFALFTRGVFHPETEWLGAAFDSMLKAEGALLELIGELKKMGYRRVCCREGKVITEDWLKLHGKKEEPIKKAWGERIHTGLELEYEDIKREPAFLWLRAPFFSKVLVGMGDMPEAGRKFLYEHAKTCEACGYCTQTDKTGKRPLAAITVEGKAFCPQMAGFAFNWRELTKELADGILAANQAMDSVLDS